MATDLELIFGMHIYDAWTTLERDDGHTRRFAALSKQTVRFGHQLKGTDSPVEAVLVD